MSRRTQDWMVVDGNVSAEMVRIVAEVSRLLIGEHTVIGRNLYAPARHIVSQLAHAQHYTPEGYVGEDWTDGNDSPLYRKCVATVFNVIKQNHYAILTYDVEGAATAIIIALTAKHRLVPSQVVSE